MIKRAERYSPTYEPMRKHVLLLVYWQIINNLKVHTSDIFTAVSCEISFEHVFFDALTLKVGLLLPWLNKERERADL